MTAPTPYLHFAGRARDALTLYAAIFGGSVELQTFADFGRSDGPADAVAHGFLTGGPVALFAADVAGDEDAFRSRGLMFALLGAAPPVILHQWFHRLSERGHIIDELQQRQWGDFDGQVCDQFGVHWLLGYEAGDPDDPPS